MAMYDTADKLREESKELFKDGLSFRQLWWIVKMSKAVRLYGYKELESLSSGQNL